MHDRIIHDQPDQLMTNNSNKPTDLKDEIDALASDTDREEKMEEGYSRKELIASANLKEGIVEFKGYIDEVMGALKRDVDWLIFKQNNTETSLLLLENMQSNIQNKTETSFQILKDIQSRVSRQYAKMQGFEEQMGRIKISMGDGLDNIKDIVSNVSEPDFIGTKNNKVPGLQKQDSEVDNQVDHQDYSTLNENQLPCLKIKKDPEYDARPIEELGQGAIKTAVDVEQKVLPGNVIISADERVDETRYVPWSNAKKRRHRRLKVKLRIQEMAKELEQNQDGKELPRSGPQNTDANKINNDKIGGFEEKVKNENNRGNQETVKINDNDRSEQKKEIDDNIGYEQSKKHKLITGNEEKIKSCETCRTEEREKNDENSESEKTKENYDNADGGATTKTSEKNERKNQVEKDSSCDSRKSHSNIDIVTKPTGNNRANRRNSLNCSKWTEALNKIRVQQTTRSYRVGEWKADENIIKPNDENQSSCSHYLTYFIIVCLLLGFFSRCFIHVILYVIFLSLHNFCLA